MERKMQQDLKKITLLHKQLKEMASQKIYLSKPGVYERKREEYKRALIDFADKYDLSASELASLMKISRQWIYYIVGRRIKTKKQMQVLKELQALKDALEILKQVKTQPLGKERKEIRGKIYDFCAKAHFWYGIAWKDIEKAVGLKGIYRRLYSPRYKKYILKYKKEEN